MTSTIIHTGEWGTDGASTPNYRALRSLGYTWRSEYILGKYSINADNIGAAFDAGIRVILNCELDPQAALGGYSKGRDYALRAVDFATSKLQWDYDCPIIFSGIDFDIQPEQYGLGDDFINGCLSVLPAQYCGQYAGRRYFDHLDTWASPELIRWQAAGWRYGADNPNINAKQYVGIVSGSGVRQDPARNIPDPRIGAIIDEDKIFRAISMWSGYGPDQPKERDMTLDELRTYIQSDQFVSDANKLVEASGNAAILALRSPEFANDIMAPLIRDNVPKGSVPPHSHNVSGTAT